MKPIPNYRPAKRSDTPAAPPWVDSLLKPINSQVSTLTERLQYRDSQDVDLWVRHGQDYEVQASNLAGEPRGAWVIFTAQPMDKPMAMAMKGDKKMVFRFSFDGAPEGEFFVRVRIEGS